jgi:hypothetical protein
MSEYPPSPNKGRCARCGHAEPKYKPGFKKPHNFCNYFNHWSQAVAWNCGRIYTFFTPKKRRANEGQ